MINELVRKGIRTLTPYEPGKPIGELRREQGLSVITKLASNENPLGPSKKAIRAIRKASASVHRYPDGNCFLLKKRLGQFLNVTPGNLIIGNGSNEIIELLVRTFVRPGDELVMCRPAFCVYRLMAAVSEACAVEVPLVQHAPDLIGVRKAITSRTRIVFIDNPNNPTGRSAGEAAVERFLEQFPPHVIVVFDEAYNEFVECEDFPDTKRYIGRKNIVILRTFSKAHGLSGLRVGYGIADAETIDYLNRARQPFNVNSIAQAAALASLEDGRHIMDTRVIVREGKHYLYEQLSDIGVRFVKSDTNFILIDTERDARAVYESLLAQGVIIRAMDTYGLPRHIRVTIGTKPENHKFIQAFKKTCGSIASHNAPEE